MLQNTIRLNLKIVQNSWQVCMTIQMGIKHWEGIGDGKAKLI